VLSDGQLSSATFKTSAVSDHPNRAKVPHFRERAAWKVSSCICQTSKIPLIFAQGHSRISGTMHDRPCFVVVPRFTDPKIAQTSPIHKSDLFPEPRSFSEKGKEKQNNLLAKFRPGFSLFRSLHSFVARVFMRSYQVCRLFLCGTARRDHWQSHKRTRPGGSRSGDRMVGSWGGRGRGQPVVPERLIGISDFQKVNESLINQWIAVESVCPLGPRDLQGRPWMPAPDALAGRMVESLLPRSGAQHLALCVCCSRACDGEKDKANEACHGALGGWRDISGLGLPGDIALNEVDYILRKARHRANGSESDSPCQKFILRRRQRNGSGHEP